MTRLLPLMILLAFAGCKSTGSRSWYSGPEEHKIATMRAIDTALAELPREIGRPLKWDWTKNRVTLRVVPATGWAHGWPTVTYNGEQVYGYTIRSVITVPVGFEGRTLIHEVGHVVFYANGNADGAWQHSLPFFKRY